MSQASMEALYKRYGPAVLRRARVLLGEEQAARDAMQEVFIRALKSDVIRIEPSPMAWLYRVTTNYCLNVRRDRARQTKLLDMNSSRQEQVAPDNADRLAVLEILERVPLELAQIAVYYYVDEMNQDEIAELAGVSRRTIGNRLEEFRALARTALGETLEIRSP